MTFIRLELSSCVSSQWSEGELLIAPDLYGDDASGRGLYSTQPLGIYARPRDPVDGKGAGCLHGFQGNDGFIMPTCDPDTIGRVPQGPPGSTVVYASGTDQTSYHYFDGTTGYQQLLVKYGANKSLSITLNTTADSESIDIRHGEGHGICLMPDGKIVMNSPNGQNYIELSDDGIVIQGAIKMIGGVATGGDSGVPVALSTEATEIGARFNAALIAGLDVVGIKATLPAPVIVATPGAAKLTAPV